MQGIWTAVLVLPRTRNVDATSGAVSYGNLYSNLLDYIIFAALIFYVLTIAGIFVLRRTRPDAERPYRALGYPILPALYMVGATTIMLVSARLQSTNDVAGFSDRADGCADLFSLEKSKSNSKRNRAAAR